MLAFTAINVPLSSGFAATYTFWGGMFWFSFILRWFLIYLMIASSTYLPCNSGIFLSHLWIFNFSVVNFWFSSFVITKYTFMCPWKECVFWCFCVECPICLLDEIKLYCFPRPLYSYLFTVISSIIDGVVL